MIQIEHQSVERHDTCEVSESVKSQKEWQMSRLTRRGFLTKASISAATIGVLTSVPGLRPALEEVEARDIQLHSKATGSLVAFVGEGSRGEITLMAGTRKVVIRDRRLVARLIHAAR
jgi:hypothetical protein